MRFNRGTGAAFRVGAFFRTQGQAKEYALAYGKAVAAPGPGIIERPSRRKPNGPLRRAGVLSRRHHRLIRVAFETLVESGYQPAFLFRVPPQVKTITTI